ncbi:hypothetical protein LF935_06260 [Pectobacterium carotovorum]|uniref:hypothetical protein n=1 Tax=Pectobacterium carotovorum TaxID=554 RepID=UPI001CF0F8A3|nr:hypothetical protein [Pectobacterium carotovorum]MCA6969236.1 hypothetical protein [Pectobacterium carotovorum]
MNWRLIIGVSLLCLAIIGVLQHRRIATLSENNAVLLAERDSTERVINNQQRTFQIFNTLSREAEHDKRQIQQDADTRSQTINQALAGQVCADEFVPDGAAVSLLDYANRLRSDGLRSSASEPNHTNSNTDATELSSQ